MSVVEKINKFLNDYEIENIDTEIDLKEMLLEAVEEIANLTKDGEMLLNEIKNRNHNDLLMRNKIKELENKIKELKK